MSDDPWQNNQNWQNCDQGNQHKQEFEDNFIPEEAAGNHKEGQSAKLPDSEQYLESLEKKLLKIKRDPNILRQLAEKREQCIRSLLNESVQVDRDGDLALDVPLSGFGSDSAVQEIYRHICPVQAVSVGETIRLVKHDQLEEQHRENEEEAAEPASR